MLSNGQMRFGLSGAFGRANGENSWPASGWASRSHRHGNRRSREAKPRVSGGRFRLLQASAPTANTVLTAAARAAGLTGLPSTRSAPARLAAATSGRETLALITMTGV